MYEILRKLIAMHGQIFVKIFDFYVELTLNE